MRAMIPPASPALLHKLRSFDRQTRFQTDPNAAVPSPCISVCRMDAAQQYCEGCLRTLEELRAWGSASAATKREIWAHIQTRSSGTPPAVAADSGKHL